MVLNINYLKSKILLNIILIENNNGKLRFKPIKALTKGINIGKYSGYQQKWIIRQLTVIIKWMEISKKIFIKSENKITA